MKPLMIYVEQAVRPLAASRGRKLKIREDWIRRLTEIYQDVGPFMASETAAMRAALERCPPREQMIHEYAAEIPWHDKLLRWIEPIPPFGKRRHSVLTFTLSTWIISLILMAVALCLTTKLMTGHWMGLEAVAVWLVHAVYFPITVGMFLGLTGALHGVLRQQQTKTRVLLFGTGLFCCVLAFAMTPLLLTRASQVKIMRGLFFSTLLAVFFTCIVAVASRRWAEVLRAEEEAYDRLLEWEQLDVSQPLAFEETESSAELHR